MCGWCRQELGMRRHCWRERSMLSTSFSIVSCPPLLPLVACSPRPSTTAPSILPCALCADLMCYCCCVDSGVTGCVHEESRRQAKHRPGGILPPLPASSSSLPLLPACIQYLLTEVVHALLSRSNC